MHQPCIQPYLSSIALSFPHALHVSSYFATSQRCAATYSKNIPAVEVRSITKPHDAVAGRVVSLHGHLYLTACVQEGLIKDAEGPQVRN